MKILDRIFKKKELSCADELNVLDIEDNIFYSLDGYISMYIRVMPIAFEYLSMEEKKQIIKRFKDEFSGENEIMKIITLSLPISINDVSEFLNEKRSKTNNAFKRSKLISQIDEMKKLSINGEMIEKQVYIQLFKKYDKNAVKDLVKRANEYVSKLQSVEIDSYILNSQEILKFFNSFLNMRFKSENINNVWSDELE